MPEHKSREAQAYAGTSDSSGGFTIKNVPAGRYRFLATHTGYVDKHYQSSGADTGAVLALQAGQEVKGVLFRMTLASVITGRVNDEDGEPMALIQVVALRRPTEDELEDQERLPGRSHELQPAGIAQTDDRGQFRVFGLKPGEYYIRAVDQYEPNYPLSDSDVDLHEALGTQYAPVYYPGVTQMGQAQTVLLSPGEEAQAEFVMRRIKTADISGRVIAPDGKPADAFLYLEEVPAADYGSFYGVDTIPRGSSM